MGGGVLVIAFEFGNLCFNSPASEQSIIMVIASPSEFSSLDKFITAALTFLETDGDFTVSGLYYIKSGSIFRLPMRI